MRSLKQLKRSKNPHHHDFAVALKKVHHGRYALADDHWTILVGMFLRTPDIRARPPAIQMDVAEETAIITLSSEILASKECLLCTGLTDEIIAQVLESLT